MFKFSRELAWKNLLAATLSLFAILFLAVIFRNGFTELNLKYGIFISCFVVFFFFFFLFLVPFIVISIIQTCLVLLFDNLEINVKRPNILIISSGWRRIFEIDIKLTHVFINRNSFENSNLDSIPAFICMYFDEKMPPSYKILLFNIALNIPIVVNPFRFFKLVYIPLYCFEKEDRLNIYHAISNDLELQ